MLDKLYLASICRGKIKLTELRNTHERLCGNNMFEFPKGKQLYISEESTPPGIGPTPKDAVNSLMNSKLNSISRSRDIIRKAESNIVVIEKWLGYYKRIGEEKL